MDMADIGALIGDRTRAQMLSALFDGCALRATELAAVAGVSASTASAHLAQLTSGGLLQRSAQGRHRYFKLASADVAAMLEHMLVVAGAAAQRPPRALRVDPGLRDARTCYDHLAGRLGVGLADALVARGAIILDDGAGEITPAGTDLFTAMGVHVTSAKRSSRRLCRPCMDWTERRPHIAGALGSALLERLLALGWVRRAAEGRVMTVTPAGRRGLASRFGFEFS